MDGPELPKAFIQLRDFVRNDVSCILRMDDASPNYAAALLMVIASEALAKLLGRRNDAVFAEELIAPHGVSATIGRGLFDAIRNGLAHIYETKVIVVERRRIVVAISWKKQPHLKVITRDWAGTGSSEPGVCINNPQLWKDLDSYISTVEERLRKNAHLRQEVTERARHDMEFRPAGPAATEWQLFIEQARTDDPGD